MVAANFNTFFFFSHKTKLCTSQLEINLQLGYKHQEDDCTLESFYMKEERRKLRKIY